MPALDRLLRPRSVTIVGASADPAKLTGRPLAYLQKYGFSGAIYPVNPRSETIAGWRCYPAISALPEPPDAAIVLLGGDKAIAAVADLAAAGTSAAIVLASGFGESGPSGEARQADLRRSAGAMRLLGPNTIGLVNVSDGIVLSASNALVNDEILAGKVALVSQSGGILGSLLSRAQATGLGFSKLVATGNEADLDVADFIAWLADDPSTAVIALYLEGLRDPDAFKSAVRHARERGKVVVAFKVGRSESGARSAASHTGALAGSDAAYDALFRQLGIVRADRYSDLIDFPLMLASGRALKGNRLAIVTSSGGAASLLADAAGLAGFETPSPDEATAAKLTALAIEGANLDRNPIDVTLAGVKSETLRTILDAVVSSPLYDAVAMVLGSSALREPKTIGTPLFECAAQTKKPVIAFASPHAPDLLRDFNVAGVPTYAAPEACAAALAALRRAGDPVRAAWSEPVAPAAPNDVSHLLKPGALNEEDSKRLFAAFGIAATRGMPVTTPESAEAAGRSFGGRVVVKVLSRQVLHKSELGGVAVGVSQVDIARTCAEMRDRFVAAARVEPEGFLVQELIEGGIEMILGLHHDPQLGPTILLGMGGIAAEIYSDTALRIVPVSREDAEGMIDELMCAPLLKGYRNRPAADVPALVDAILAFSRMAETIGGNVAEAEINPLFVLSKGRGAIAGDGLVVVKDTGSPAGRA